jgi:hypothetical protein
MNPANERTSILIGTAGQPEEGMRAGQKCVADLDHKLPCTSKTRPRGLVDIPTRKQ